MSDIFPGRRHVVLPVIHVENTEQALRNAQLAKQFDCDGVFLINHGITAEELLTVHHSVAQELPGFWMGLNCLDVQPEDIFSKVPDTVSGIWVDNAAIDECQQDQSRAEQILSERQRSGWQGVYFGGVAFKYQRPVQDMAKAAGIAAAYMDVVTTSGPGTGEAASIEKISTMKTTLGKSPLAIASGITPENVSDYLPYADCFLVATGISRNWTELDPAKLESLMKRVLKDNS